MILGHWKCGAFFAAVDSATQLVVRALLRAVAVAVSAAVWTDRKFVRIRLLSFLLQIHFDRTKVRLPALPAVNLGVQAALFPS